ncbi:serine/threonine phosphatase stp [Erysipelotrichaceae bacterium]|nr:serine/threonine phosphatase stp [Erysipelotrichaceae bacterium]
MKTFVESDQGLVRTRNEDYTEIFEKNGVILMAVADGMGGHRAGDVASRMSLKCLKIAFENFDVSISKEDAKKWIGKVFEKINNIIHQEAEKTAEYIGMGTTLVTALISPAYIIIGNVGDSRAYITTDEDILMQVTEDHTLVAELYRQGELSIDELETHPNKNILLQAIGTEEDIVVDVFDLEGGRPKKILLCSDGLTGMITNEVIENTLSKLVEIDIMGRELIAKANENGGKDNITVAIWSREGGEKNGD